MVGGSVRTLTYAQVTAALEPCGDNLQAMSYATYQMARKAYCKAAKVPDMDTNRTLKPHETLACFLAIQSFGRQAICRMATFLIDESAKAGELG
jgi:hypothetical protein